MMQYHFCIMMQYHFCMLQLTMELKLKKKFGKLLAILQNYLIVNYRKLP